MLGKSFLYNVILTEKVIFVNTYKKDYRSYFNIYYGKVSKKSNIRETWTKLSQL